MIRGDPPAGFSENEVERTSIRDGLYIYPTVPSLPSGAFREANSQNARGTHRTASRQPCIALHTSSEASSVIDCLFTDRAACALAFFDRSSSPCATPGMISACEPFATNRHLHMAMSIRGFSLPADVSTRPMHMGPTGFDTIVLREEAGRGLLAHVKQGYRQNELTRILLLSLSWLSLLNL